MRRNCRPAISIPNLRCPSDLLFAFCHLERLRRRLLPGFLVSLAARLIASWNDILAFYHHDYGAFRRPCAMLHALGHDESLTRSKIDGAILEIDHYTACNYVKEFI